MILTRWHEDDLAGRILPTNWDGESGRIEGRDGRVWHVLCLPAIADRPDDPLGRAIGDVLWPEWFSKNHFAPFMSNRRTWSSLYQQKPSPDDGDYFKSAWFASYNVLPHGLNYYGASDYAVTDGGGDYTEHGIFGVDFNGNVYVVDWWSGQTTSDIWIESQCDLIIKYEPLMWFGESGVIRRSIEPFMMSRMSARRAYCTIEWMASISDKPTRARNIQALASMGKVYFPETASWKDRVITQLLKFPAGKYDDAVDVVSLIGRGLQHIRAPNLYDEDDNDNQTGRSSVGGY
jgi:predicted phage terminase large subunit-like protein